MESLSIYEKIDLVKAKVGKLTKDTTNPFHKSKYADINQLIELTDPLLREQGLMCLQPVLDGNLVTQIIDVKSGNMITSSLEIPKILDPQKIGGAITYFRRYTLKSLLNLQEEDDDGNKASGREKEPQADKDNRPWLNQKQFNQALIRIKNKEEGVYEKINKAFRIKSEYRDKLKAA
ncbi:hypothetical protein G7074_18010 [Pedobacter sp. HDW13]|uniref:ERF family protein n=1 Tax=Pedobacter sp. HDW13 TaxID=2714940 RepID=UPI001408BF0E|nr:ERF family protein [Pedobacter sp. HDW13]QIL40994.1 hypothetical protein G7074_18010 [Pedobacter sp. HDW13]